MALARGPLEKIQADTTDRHIKGLAAELIAAKNRIYELESLHTQTRDAILALKGTAETLAAKIKSLEKSR